VLSSPQRENLDLESRFTKYQLWELIQPQKSAIYQTKNTLLHFHHSPSSLISFNGISLRKQPTFREVATWALAKRRLSNERRNSILMTRHYPDLGSASDWLKREEISATNQKHYLDLGSDAASVWNFCARYSDVVLQGLKWWPRKRRLFSQATTESAPKRSDLKFF